MNPFKVKPKKVEQNEEKNEKDKKAILNTLLKQLLDQRLNKLEKNNIAEIKTFQTLSNETQNLILSLEEMSNNVRKTISIRVQKYINNGKSLKPTSKIPTGRPISPKSIPKQYSKKNLNIKRKESKSYSKYNALQTDINSRNNKSQILGNKSKSKKKLMPLNTKANDSGRKTVANLNLNKPSLIPRSNQRRTLSPFLASNKTDRFNKTLNNRTSNLSKKKVSAQKNKSIGKKAPISKIERNTKKTPGKNANTTKDNKKVENPNLKKDININVYNNNNISILDKQDSNLDDTRLKELDVFRQSQKGLGNEENLNIIKDIKNKNDNNKNKNEKKCPLLNTLSKEFEKISTIKMDDKIVNDSLLVTSNLEGGKTVNIGELFRGPTFKEMELSNNTDIKNSNFLTEVKNKEENDIKTSAKKKELLKSSLLIYNKLKRTKVTFLEGKQDFDLIFKDSKIMDFDLDSNLNKDIDLNATQVSDHMSLEEKLESNLDIISQYLDTRDIFKLMLVNKECFKSIINFLISKYEISIELLQEEINRIKEFNPNIQFQHLNRKPFKLSSNSLRALSLLNSSSGNNILKLSPNEINKKEIILVYSLFFVAIGLKKDVLTLDENEKIEYMQNYFKKNCIGKYNFGSFIEKEMNGKVFDDKVISTIYNLSKNQLEIISPNYFQKINKDIAIFVFIIKDLLEQIGLLGTQFPKPEKEFLLYNSRLQANKAILEELNKIEEYI